MKNHQEQKEKRKFFVAGTTPDRREDMSGNRFPFQKTLKTFDVFICMVLKTYFKN